MWPDPPLNLLGFSPSSNTDCFLTICSTSSVGVLFVSGSDPFRPAPIPHLASSTGFPFVLWFHWENLCNCNVYYADQGLQITTVHFWHPSCTLTVWQLVLHLDSAVWCSLQHGSVFLPWASAESLFYWLCDRATVAFSITKVILQKWCGYQIKWTLYLQSNCILPLKHAG